MTTQHEQVWHAIVLDKVYEEVNSTSIGLSESEVTARLEQYGSNRLPDQPSPSKVQIVLRQFYSPLIFILGLASLMSVLIGDFKDAAFIASVLMINALIGGYQEYRAEQSSRALKQLLKNFTSVLRDGEVQEINAEDLVQGDIVWLESGNRVPADLRLIQSHNLEIDESLLTGESLTVLKQADWLGDAFTPIAEHRNMVYAGTTVARGRAKGLVVATGISTAVGQLAQDVVATAGGKPPLLLRIERFSRVIAVGVLVAALGISWVGIMRHGYSLIDMFMFGVALAVSAIPEGLPVALTVALAIATRRMAKCGVIVRRLPAVEGLGSCTLIASDKTGTLTCNELTVRIIYLPSGELFNITGEGFIPEGYILSGGQIITPDQLPLDRIARAAVLCNEADLHRHNNNWVWRGDPTDIALLTMAQKMGWSRESTLNLCPQVNEIPFEPEHQFAATYHVIDGQIYALVKGAPERVFTMCKLTAEGSLPWAQAEQMAAEGYRVLALAEGIQTDQIDSKEAIGEPCNLTLLGLIGMIDPLRPGVREAIANCHRAGVNVWMVTGDHPATALAIAQSLGLASHTSEVVTGREVAESRSSELRQLIQRSSVFARVAPHQKLRLVNAAKELGHYVAVTGDGVNDAPALRAANIGVAMGKSGTDVAREAAELVISDDNFATIVAGIEQGRIAYDNVRKVVYLLVSTGAAELVLIGLAVGQGLPLPLLPIQLLWLNLVTNGIQDVALAFEPGEGDELHRRPRSPREPVFNRLMIERTLIAAAVIGIISFATYRWMLDRGWSELAARNNLLLLMVLFENVQIANSRSEVKSAFSRFIGHNPILLFGTAAAFSIHVLMMYLPIGRTILQTQPVGIREWGVLAALSLVALLAIEIHKLLRLYLSYKRRKAIAIPNRI